VQKKKTDDDVAIGNRQSAMALENKSLLQLELPQQLKCCYCLLDPS
jgi:hypothetical protein